MGRIPTSKTTVGRVVRLPLKVVRPGWQMPVMRGTLRGRKWVAGSGNAGHWLGTFESATCRVFAEMVEPGFVVYEMGAFVGYYTLQASLLVGPSGRVFSFEPGADSLAYLKQNLRINGVTNVTVVEEAVGEYSGTTSFRVDLPMSLRRPDDVGTVTVPMVSLDDFVRRRGIPLPDLIKIDVVGSELGVLRGAMDLLRTHRPPLVMRIHSYDLDPAWTAFLRDLGYELTPFEGSDFSTAGGLTAKWADGKS